VSERQRAFRTCPLASWCAFPDKFFVMVCSEGGEDARIFNTFRLTPKALGALPGPTVPFNPELDS